MKTKIILSAIFGISMLFSSCLSDLDTQPLDPTSETPDVVYSQEGNYIKGLLKIYSVFAMSGQNGEGESDIEGLDAGNTQLYRTWWNLQVVPTDEAIVSWQDPWVTEMNEMKWTSTQNEAIEGVYQRCMYIVAIANEYLKQTTDDMMASRGIGSNFFTTVHQYRYEARMMRALAYYMLMDTYARPPFITENNYSTAPEQIPRAELFDWLETELKELTTNLPVARSSYGRADRGFAFALLSRMYLNAEVYSGVARYTECIAASNEVINAGYSLASVYANLFRADNNVTSSNEIIFPILYDGTATQTYGGMRFLICASRGPGEVSVETDGLKGGWSGNRARKNLIEKFSFADPNYAEKQDASSILDKRGIFYAKGRTLEITSWVKTFETQGWAVYKYSNLKSDGTPGSNEDHPDTDIAFFRLGEVYLNYAEAVKRGGQGGSEDKAVEYINMLRRRGYGNSAGSIAAKDMTLDFLLDERSRELYWEATRRTDLIRYDYFTTAKYLWPFKGGVSNGSSVESYRNVYPIPVSDISVNPSLTQNEGYY